MLVFKHPTAGIQLPAGTVEVGEDIETAVFREVFEETGIRDLKIEKYLGFFENELEEDERIISGTTAVYIEPSLTSIPYQQKLNRGLTVRYLATHDEFMKVSYIEYDKYPNPEYITLNISGWVPKESIASQKKRHFFHLTPVEKTKYSWSLKSDNDHIFRPFWTPLSPKPLLVEKQQSWLDFAYGELVG